MRALDIYTVDVRSYPLGPRNEQVWPNEQIGDTVRVRMAEV